MATRIPLALLATALACSLFAAPAHALRARVFVAKTGADVGTCSFSAPCQSLNFAYNAVLPGGEITMLDNAGYEPLTINKALTITSPAGVEAGIVASSGGIAITVTAGPADDVTLRGLTIDGGNNAADGIQFNSGRSLTIEDCSIHRFINAGVFVQPVNPVSRFYVSKTRVTDNNAVSPTWGIYVRPGASTTVRGILDGVEMSNNYNGLGVRRC